MEKVKTLCIRYPNGDYEKYSIVCEYYYNPIENVERAIIQHRHFIISYKHFKQTTHGKVEKGSARLLIPYEVLIGCHFHLVEEEIK